MRRLLLVALLFAAGCGSAEEASGPATQAPPAATTHAETVGATDPAPAATTTLSVYFLRDGKIAAAERTVPETQAVARAALEQLAAGPTAAERAAGLATDVPGALEIRRLAIAGGVATVDLGGCAGVPQIVYTLTQFPTVERVRGNCIEGAGLGRADLEDVTPQIFVESPVVGQAVTSPVRIRGTANTFEATFTVELTDGDGDVVGQQVVTATSGSGERGTFDVTVPFTVERPGGTLTAFAESAEDGSRQHVVRIPLDLQPAG